MAQAVDVSKIKLIIWDLDDTFWTGTISEQEVAPASQACDLVLMCAKKGIISSVCSKNDMEPCVSKLREWGMDKYFVFMSVNWRPKGERIKEILSAMNLRAENTLFIDDNALNLEEAVYYSPELMTAGPDKIPWLYERISQLDKSDETMSRLESYRLLEKKHKIKESMGSNEDFLRQSNIRAEFHTDCTKHTERLHELVMRANQLNFTKLRPDKEEFAALLKDKSVNSGYITASDKYGEYGIIGFYAVKDNKLVHFLFSCRTLGMGLEQYAYAKLGFPELEIIGDVSVSIGKDTPVPDWINTASSIQENDFEDIKKTDFKVLMKGPCDLNQIFSFIKNEDMFDCEFTYVSREKHSLGVSIEGMNHTAQIVQAYSVTEEQKNTVCALPFTESHMFSDCIYKNDYGMVFISILTDANLGVYRHRKNGCKIAFGEYIYPLTEESMWDKYINKEVYTANCNFTREFLQQFAQDYEFLGRLSAEQTADNLKFIREHISSDTELVIMLGCEREYKDNILPAWCGRHNDHLKLNDCVRRVLGDCENVTLFDVNEYITSDDDFGDSINHYKKRVYYLMAQRFTELINNKAKTDIAKRTSKIKLAYQTLRQSVKKLIKPHG